MHKKLMLLFAVAVATCVGGFAADSPHIVKRFHLYNQTEATGPITIYTPKLGHGGMFRVNTFILVTVGNGQGQAWFCGSIGFTSRSGPGSAGAVMVCPHTTNAGDTAE